MNTNTYSEEIPLILKNGLKVCSGNYNNGSIEFSGTYKDGYKNGKDSELGVGVWNFWYPNDKMKFEGLYKDGTLVSKKYWDINGETIDCNLSGMTEPERYKTFKEK